MSRLNHPPPLGEGMETLLNVVENVAGDCPKADAAEQTVREEGRTLGNVAVPCWAEQAGQTAPTTVRHQQPTLQGKGKKSLLAEAFRENLGHRTGLAGAWPPEATVAHVGRGDPTEVFPAVATGHSRLWR